MWRGIRKAVLAVLASAVVGTMFAPMANAEIILPPLECGTEIKTDVTLSADMGPCKGDGLVVAKDGVTVDLNGHEVTGSANPGTVGIRNVGFEDVTVTGGTVKLFEDGVRFEDADGSMISGLSAMLNVDDGMQLKNSDELTVTSSAAASNGGNGMELLGFGDGLLQDNVASSNGETGMTMAFSQDNDVVSNTISGNGKNGLYMLLGNKNVVKKNEVTHNALIGINSQSNQLWINGNTVEENKIGILSDGDDVVLKKNVVRLNAGKGIDVYGTGNSIRSNIVRLNDGAGIYVGEKDTGNTVALNTATGNGYEGDVDDDAGLGIDAPKGTKGSDNVAKKNDDPKQCLPKKLCS